MVSFFFFLTREGTSTVRGICASSCFLSVSCSNFRCHWIPVGSYPRAIGNSPSGMNVPERERYMKVSSSYWFGQSVILLLKGVITNCLFIPLCAFLSQSYLLGPATLYASVLVTYFNMRSAGLHLHVMMSPGKAKPLQRQIFFLRCQMNTDTGFVWKLVLLLLLKIHISLLNHITVADRCQHSWFFFIFYCNSNSYKLGFSSTASRSIHLTDCAFC